MKKAAFIIADKDEYVRLDKYIDGNTEETEIYGMKSHIFKINNPNGEIMLQTVCSGIGKVNATVAATYFAGSGFDIIISGGFSGGLSGVSKNDIITGTEYVEHDFDLTVLGYKLGEKPGQRYIYSSPEYLINDITEMFPFIKKGVFATGDSFICDCEKRKTIIDTFGAAACDMETACIAYVCNISGIDFLSVRMISDGAGDNATDDYYTSLQDGDISNLWVKIIFDWLEKSKVIG